MNNSHTLRHIVIALALSFFTFANKSHAIDLNKVNDINGRIDVGISVLKTKVLEDHSNAPDSYGDATTSPLIGFALNKRVGEQSLLGTKIEFQRIDGSLLTAFRAIDYRYIIDGQWQVGAYIGAARYDFRSPAYGYTLGFGAFYQPTNWQNWSLGTEVQFMDKMARDKIHPDDVPGTAATGPDTFTNMAGLSFTLSYHF
mgnify:CR=1 FL=1